MDLLDQIFGIRRARGESRAATNRSISHLVVSGCLRLSFSEDRDVVYLLRKLQELIGT